MMFVVCLLICIFHPCFCPTLSSEGQTIHMTSNWCCHEEWIPACLKCCLFYCLSSQTGVRKLMSAVVSHSHPPNLATSVGKFPIIDQVQIIQMFTKQKLTPRYHGCRLCHQMITSHVTELKVWSCEFLTREWVRNQQLPYQLWFRLAWSFHPYLCRYLHKVFMLECE